MAVIDMICEPKKILLTGARSPAALEVARLLHHGGHEIYTADTSYFQVCRFSNAVRKSFVIPAPSENPEKFIQTVLNIIEKEKIDILIPIWEEVLYISKQIERFPKSCKVFCSSFETIDRLHNKHEFIVKLKELGFLVPRTELIQSLSDFEHHGFQKPFALKACYCRGSRKVMKVMPGELPTVDFSPNNPWIAQEWIDGERFCTYSVCHNGTLLAHSVYPVKYTLEDGSSCIAFDAYEHPGIFEWVKKLVGELKYTGQIAFDFIETADKKIYAIECNPRATSGVHLFAPEDKLDRAYLNHAMPTIKPKPGRSKQIATGMLVYGLKMGHRENRLKQYIKKTFTTPDVVFSWRDLKPFIFEPIIFSSYWLKSLRKKTTIPKVFTSDFDWDGERR